MTNSPPVRVPRLRPEQLTDEQWRLYQEALEGPRGQGPQFFPLTDADGVLTGPFNAMLASPRVGTSIVGYYWLLAAQLRLFRVGRPPPAARGHPHP